MNFHVIIECNACVKTIENCLLIIPTFIYKFLICGFSLHIEVSVVYVVIKY